MRRLLLLLLSLVPCLAVRLLDDDSEGRARASQLSLTSPARNGSNACCGCPALDCDSVNKRAGQLMSALEKVAPASWFLIEGSLIAALRYGGICHVLKSGKKNLVDSDIDVAVVTPQTDKERLARALAEELPDWSPPKTPKADSKLLKMGAPAGMPSSSCEASGNKTVGDFHVDLHFIFRDAGRLTPEDEYNHIWQKLLHNSTQLPTNLIFPLRATKLADAVAYVPYQYMRVLTNWEDNEYGQCDTLWLPIEKHLATGEKFECPCQLETADREEIKASISNLHSAGRPSLGQCLGLGKKTVKRATDGQAATAAPAALSTAQNAQAVVQGLANMTTSAANAAPSAPAAASAK